MFVFVYFHFQKLICKLILSFIIVYITNLLSLDLNCKSKRNQIPSTAAPSSQHQRGSCWELSMRQEKERGVSTEKDEKIKQNNKNYTTPSSFRDLEQWHRHKSAGASSPRSRIE